jgi:WD40 repeat protein
MRWGVWSGDSDNPILAAADGGAGFVWRATGGAGAWTPLAEGRGNNSAGASGQPWQRLDWGAWGEIDGQQVLAGGGLWSESNAPGLLLLYADIDRLVPFENVSGEQTTWGSWGEIDGDPVLATGDDSGLARLWDPRTRTERGVIRTNVEKYKVVWGAWGTVEGQPILTISAKGALQTWSADILRNPPGAASAGLGPMRRLRADPLWGAWGEVRGVPTLAFGDMDAAVNFYNQQTDHYSTLQLSGLFAPNSWAEWGQSDNGPVLMVGDQEGNVWFCDPETLSAHQLKLGQPVRWGSWGRLNGQAVLAAGTEHGEVLIWDLLWERAVPRVPRYLSDTGGQADLLGRQHDAAALADVITARSARPPLAVGVFGQWGDGKSTFLEMLQEEVGERARAAGPSDPIAHGQVRQVRFNAWHYAEADLWASMVAELFAQLSDGTGDPAREQRQRSRLASELVQSRGLREQYEAANDRLAALRRVSAAGSGSWASLTPATQQDLRILLGKNAEEQYKKFGTTSPVLRPSLHSVAAVIRVVPKRIWLVSVVAALLAVGLVTWGPGVVRWFAALPPVAVIVLAAGAIRNGWERAKPAREALGSAWQTVQRIRDEQQRRLETAEAVAAAEVDELRARLQNLTSAGQLAGVVQERAGAASYRERLGLMTQIRQDFERMAELLRPDETPADVPVEDAAGDELPAIDRIVVYIDDLDRCPPDRVVEVLEAVHLLLAVRLFVVVVAVDPRWLLRSLTSHYQELFATAGAMSDEDELWASTPAQYLEKIFQIVLTLPPMGQTGYRRLIYDLVGLRASPTPGSASGWMPNAALIAMVQSLTSTGMDHVAAVAAAASIEGVPLTDAMAMVGGAPPPPTGGAVTSAGSPPNRMIDLNSRIVDRFDPLALTPEEFELINLLGPPLVSGPRSVKRLANSYGLLIATSRPDDLSAGRRPDLDPVPDLTGTVPPYRAGMALLAAVIGYPMLGPYFFPELHRAAAQSDKAWLVYLKELRPSESFGNQADRTMTAGRKKQWNAFLDALEEITARAAEAGQPLPQSLAIWATWVVPVGRLSFPTGSAVSRLASP